ncbi:MAG: hypothetical protein ABSB74_09895 [Tepidisphaeraceae bacterium]
MDQTRQLLRHALATLAYRAGKALSGVPASFADMRACASGRSAVEILSHMSDLLNWVGWLARGENGKPHAKPQGWDFEVTRFYTALRRLDDWLASDAPLHCDPRGLFQGPIADALTHVGQLAMLRRLAGSPIRGENYFLADIAVGRVGAEQSAPREEFD